MGQMTEAERQAWQRPFQLANSVSMTPVQVKKLLNAEHASVEECMLFLNKCKQYGADPFMNDMYLIKYAKKDKAAFVTSVGFFEKKANANPRFAGFCRTEWLSNANGKLQWVDFWVSSIHGKNPVACRASCWIKGYKEPQTFVVNWEENSKNSNTWRSMPSRMLEKVARVGLLRSVLPEDVAGLYLSEEINGEEMPAPTVQPVIEDQNQKFYEKPDTGLTEKTEVKTTKNVGGEQPENWEEQENVKTAASEVAKVLDGVVIDDGELTEDAPERSDESGLPAYGEYEPYQPQL
jgi:phage recombination protein Bet